MKKIILLLFSVCSILILSNCNQSATDDTNNTKNIDTNVVAGDNTIKVINDKIARDSTDPSGYYARAKYHIGNYQYDHAADDLIKAISLDSTNSEYYLLLADDYFFMKQTFNTKTTLEHCLLVDPKNQKAAFKLAELYFYIKKYPDAIKYIESAIQLNDSNMQAHFLRAMILKEKGDTAKSITEFQNCIERKPDFYDAFMQLGVIYSAQNNKLAIQYFNGALKLKPQSEEALYGRAMFYQNTNDFDNAIQDYTSLSQLNPANKDAYFNLAFIHQVYLKVYNEAIKYYSQTIKIDSTYYKAFYNRGLCYETLGDIGAAKSDFQKAIDIMPSYNKAREGLKRVMK